MLNLSQKTNKAELLIQGAIDPKVTLRCHYGQEYSSIDLDDSGKSIPDAGSKTRNNFSGWLLIHYFFGKEGERSGYLVGQGNFLAEYKTSSSSLHTGTSFVG